MQRAAIAPRANDRPLLYTRPLYIGIEQSQTPHAHRQLRRPCILRLHTTQFFHKTCNTRTLHLISRKKPLSAQTQPPHAIMRQRNHHMPPSILLNVQLATTKQALLQKSVAHLSQRSYPIWAVISGKLGVDIPKGWLLCYEGRLTIVAKVALLVRCLDIIGITTN